MNWLIIGLPLAAVYAIWFGYLIYNRAYSKELLFYSLAFLPYCFANVVAPFRGFFDADYAGYNIGWIHIPQGILVTLVAGSIAIFSLILASRGLQNRMKNLWVSSFVFTLFLSIFIALPVLIDIISDLSGFRLELGEYLQISGVWTALLVFVLFTGPTFYACILSGKKSLTSKRKNVAD